MIWHNCKDSSKNTRRERASVRAHVMKKRRKGEPSLVMNELLRDPTTSLWCRKAKNPDVVTGPLTCFVHLFAHTACLLTHSRARKKVNHSMAVLAVFFSVLDHSAPEKEANEGPFKKGKMSKKKLKKRIKKEKMKKKK